MKPAWQWNLHSLIYSSLPLTHPALLQVLNVILSHQALPRKAELVLGVLDTLVASAAPQFKLQLAQLSALPTVSPLDRVVQRAQQLLDHALLSELSVAIASALIPPLTPTNSVEASEDPSSHRRLGSSAVDGVSTAVGDLELESLEQAAAKVLHDLKNRASLTDRCCPTVLIPMLSNLNLKLLKDHTRVPPLSRKSIQSPILKGRGSTCACLVVPGTAICIAVGICCRRDRG